MLKYIPQNQIWATISNWAWSPAVWVLPNTQPVEGGSKCLFIFPTFFLLPSFAFPFPVSLSHLSFTLAKPSAPTQPNLNHHLTFLQLVTAHHDACNVTLVSCRQTTTLPLPSSSRETKKSIVSSRWETMNKNKRVREVCQVTIKHDPSTTQNLLEFEQWNHCPAEKWEISLPLCVCVCVAGREKGCVCCLCVKLDEGYTPTHTLKTQSYTQIYFLFFFKKGKKQKTQVWSHITR